jgi:hypothetical protein
METARSELQQAWEAKSNKRESSKKLRKKKKRKLTKTYRMEVFQNK